MPFFVIPIILVLLFMLERYIFNRYWQRNLSVILDFEKEAVTEGEETGLEEVVTNRNFIPLHILQVNFQTDVGLDFTDTSNASVTDRVNVVDVFSLRFYERITRKLTISCKKRGYYNILQTSMVASDMFSSDIHYGTREQSTSLYVYPRLLPENEVSIPFRQLMGEVVSRRYLYEDTFTFRGIRDYTSTDPMSDINWKASARTGELKVNLHDYTSGPEVKIILNVEEPGILYESELLENCIRMAVSLAVKLIDKKIPVSLLTNGKDKITKENVTLNAGASKEHIRNFCRALARIDLSHHETDSIKNVVERAISNESSNNMTYCLVSTSRRDEVTEIAGKLCDVQGSLIWIYPFTKDMDQSPLNDRRIELIKILYE